MRKAFDANVPKFKPRLKGAATLPLEELVDEAPHAVRVPIYGAAPRPAEQSSTEAGAHQMEVAREPSAGEGLRFSPPAAGPLPATTLAEAAPVTSKVTAALTAAPAAAEVDDVGARRARLEKIKARVAEAARPAARAEPTPGNPQRAAERVLGLAHDLEVELGRAREREEALRADLEAARGDATRAATEARSAGERLAASETELEEKRGVLADLLSEMNALEAERDEALRRAQAMAALDEERARLLEDLSRRADEEARARAAREADVERLTEELRESATDGARLRAALAELSRERDQLASELSGLRRDRDELDAAKRALEQVHTALSQARARLG